MEMTKAYFPSDNVRASVVDDFREGKTLFLQANLISFGPSYTSRFEEIFGEEIAYIGYPTEDGKGGASFYIEDFLISIAENSEVKDGAFAYLKYILTDVQFLGIDEISATGWFGDTMLIGAFPDNRIAIILIPQPHILLP
jgi:hypothetical protein